MDFNCSINLNRIVLILVLSTGNFLLYSSSHNFIFIHIAKNGGASIRAILDKYSSKSLPRTKINEIISSIPFKRRADRLVHYPHIDAIWLRKRIGHKIFDNAFSFAVIRNPYDQMVSRYEYIRSNKNHHANRDALRLKFGEFMELQSSRDWNFTKTQLSKISNEKGKVIISQIYRFENYDKIMPDLCKNIDIELPSKTTRINVSVRGRYQDYYDSKAKTFVEKYFSEDLEYFKYKF